MVNIQPTRGLTYTVGNTEKFICPPYDVGTDAFWGRLKREGHFTANLIRNDDPNEAANQLSQYIQHGILRRDEESFYVYQQEFRHEGNIKNRTGLICLMQLDPSGQVIRPHERIKPKPLKGRLELLSKLKAHAEKGLYLYEGQNTVNELLDRAIEGQKPIVEYGDNSGSLETGVKHTFYRITDKDLLKHIQRVMQDKLIIIADGHHRYTTALIYHLGEKILNYKGVNERYSNLARELIQKGEISEDYLKQLDGPNIKGSDYILACLCDWNDPGVVIKSINRALKLSGDQEKSLWSTIEKDFDIYRIALSTSYNKMMENSKNGFGLIIGGKRYFLELKEKDYKSIFDSTSVGLTQRILDALKIDPTDGDSIKYPIIEAEFNEAIRRGFNTVLFPQAITGEQLEVIVRNDEVCGPKSTNFFPKVSAGGVSHIIQQII